MKKTTRQGVLKGSIYLAAILGFLFFLWDVSVHCHYCVPKEFLLGTEGYGDQNIKGLFAVISHRIAVQPFNLISLLIFIFAILHTFFAPFIHTLSQRVRAQNVKKGIDPPETFSVEILRLLGEIEVIFGIWIIPLMIAMNIFFGWSTCLKYLESLGYTEPLFVVVIMTLASTRPIVELAEKALGFIASLGKRSPVAWWWSILTLGPLTGSLITEPGAMTISALLLAKQFYRWQPSTKLAYSTLGLLFVNVSVGGVFTSFAAPPVLMVSKLWGWDTGFMTMNFGFKVLIGILLSNFLYYILFKKEFAKLTATRKEEEQSLPYGEKQEAMPFWITLAHLAFLSWVVVHAHYPVIFIGSFLLFIGFHQATIPFQYRLNLKSPILVGFFLAGLVVHGNLQAWWIAPMLSNVSKEVLMVVSTILTAFNDNAEITFLASLIPTFSPEMKYAVVAGAVTGGGLTVIANAPNPLGQSLLSEYFPAGIKPVSLFLAALPPTLIVGTCLYFFRFGGELLQWLFP